MSDEIPLPPPEDQTPLPRKRGGIPKGTKRPPYKRHGSGGCVYSVDGQPATEAEIRGLWKRERYHLAFYWHAKEGLVTNHPWLAVRGVRLYKVVDVLRAARFRRYPDRGFGSPKVAKPGRPRKQHPPSFPDPPPEGTPPDLPTFL